MQYHQHAPITLRAPNDFPASTPAFRIAIVTPSFNQAPFIGATIDSVLSQRYPSLHYHVQDGGSADGTVDILKARDVSWRSEADAGQADAINKGFAGIRCDVMAYLNSDDILLPGSLAYVAKFFQERPDIDLVYGHRIFIDENGHEIGRAVMPRHDPETLKFVDFVPQETMFWRAKVWERVGHFDQKFQFALDWDFLLRAQQAGFKMKRVSRFLGGFRVHGSQKTTVIRQTGLDEIEALKSRSFGRAPSRMETLRHVAPYMGKQLAYHLMYRARLLPVK